MWERNARPDVVQFDGPNGAKLWWDNQATNPGWCLSWTDERGLENCEPIDGDLDEEEWAQQQAEGLL